MSAMTPDMEKKLTIHNVGEMDFTFRSRTSPTRLTPVRDSAGGMPLTRWKLTARYTNTHRKETMKSDHLMNQIRQKTTWYPNSLIQSHLWRNPDISIKNTIKAITAPMESHKTWTRRRLSTKVSMLGANYHRAPVVPQWFHLHPSFATTVFRSAGLNPTKSTFETKTRFYTACGYFCL